jgi:hypothetical protein
VEFNRLTRLDKTRLTHGAAEHRNIGAIRKGVGGAFLANESAIQAREGPINPIGLGRQKAEPCGFRFLPHFSKRCVGFDLSGVAATKGDPGIREEDTREARSLVRPEPDPTASKQPADATNVGCAVADR